MEKALSIGTIERRQLMSMKTETQNIRKWKLNHSILSLGYAIAKQFEHLKKYYVRIFYRNATNS